MRKIVSLWLSFFLFPFLAFLSEAGELKGEISRVVDGDTCWVRTAGQGDVKVQLQGIDAPEPRLEYGPEAKELLSSLVEDKMVRVETDGKDRYGRTVGRIYADGVDVNLEMVRRGMARYVARYAPGAEDLRAAQEEARAARRGIWGKPSSADGVASEAVSRSSSSGRKVAVKRKTEKSPELAGRVWRVMDGDTCCLMTTDGEEVKIRLHGIDAPEYKQAYGREAKEELSSLVLDREVRVTVESTDRYGRTVGRIDAGGVDVNLEMVRRGAAWHYVYYAADEDGLADAQKEAKAARRGIWAASQPTPPWEFRRRKKP